MLRLEGAAVLVRHQLAQLLHHQAVPLHLCLRAEALGEDQVEVALKGVAEAGGVVVLELLEHVDEVAGHGSQLFHRAGDVLNEHAGARLARPTHDGDQALAHVPEELGHLGLVAEGELLDAVHERNLAALEGVQHLRNVRLQHRLLLPAALDQQRRAVVVAPHQPVHLLDHALVALALAQAGGVEHLHRVHACLHAQHVGRLARVLHRREHHER
mmetsp:Transcript_12601/g.26585  ORF Transcript_12601/g.26585 Transcript_12601/m.26585 type:complete len:214 (+) Transcript_12601:701-1342(+)